MCNSSVQPILALLGHPVTGNPTQFMIEKALEQRKLDWRYLSLEVPAERLGDAVRGMWAMGFRGGNCTAPHQTTIASHLVRVDRVAELTGAVNLLVREEHELVGQNTEGRGLLEAIQRKVDPAGKRIVLLGAGRMARAAAVELALAKVGEIRVVNRTEASAKQLVELLTGPLETPASYAVWDGDHALTPDVDVLIDATAGCDGARPLSLNQLPPSAIVADVSLDPPRTELLNEAAGRGCVTIGGLEIFVDQVAVNFRRWTGVDPDAVVLREAAEEFLEL